MGKNFIPYLDCFVVPVIKISGYSLTNLIKFVIPLVKKIDYSD